MKNLDMGFRSFHRHHCALRHKRWIIVEGVEVGALKCTE